MIFFLFFLKKKEEERKKKQLSLVKAYNFQIHHFIEGDALNLSEYFPALIFFKCNNNNNVKQENQTHFTESGVSYIFLVWYVFLQLIF